MTKNRDNGDLIYYMCGEVIFLASNTAPQGFLRADGSLVSQATYADLYVVCGTTFGAGNATHFALPDLRGSFCRGADAGRGIDTSRTFGSTQSWAIQNITGAVGTLGTMCRFNNSSASGAFALSSSTSTAAAGGGNSGSLISTLDASTQVQTSTETRPHNVSLVALIRY